MPMRVRNRFAAVLVATLTACSCARVAMDTGVPGVPVSADVELVAERYHYIDATVETGGKDYRFFFPRTPTCHAIITAPDPRFKLDGMIGTLERGDAECVAVGVLSLAQWRDRQGRVAREYAGTRSVIPRDRIEYQVVYEDEDVFLARGRFRLAGQIGWVGGVDSIAIFPNDAACRGVRENVRGTMEFRATGKQVFTVVSGSTLCPVLGFAQVIAAPAES
jgi:hypothetical protein